MPVAIARLLGRAGDIPRAQGFVLATMLAVVTGLLILVVDALDRDRIAGAVTDPALRTAPALEAQDITVAFGGRTVLDGISLHVDHGEIVALRGPSGSGKTTLLRVLTGLVRADAGTVVVNGRDVTSEPTHRRRIGMVFQDNQLFTHRDVRGNVEFGLRMHAVPRADRARRVGEVLELVGLDGFEQRDVTSLSGGEAKRVALARSLAPQPSVLLLDEPLTGLDKALHDQLARDLATVLRARRISTILVTHDAAEAATMSDRSVEIPT
jgi:thiamine transport system ATP-binding protein